MEEKNLGILKQTNSLISKESVKFGILFFGLLAVWYFLYEVIIKPNDLYDKYVIEAISSQGAWLLNLLGFETSALDYSGNGFTDFVQIQNSPGVTIGAGCDGLVIIALFVIFVSLFRGSLKHKLWFIPLGVALIHLLNIIRVAILAIIVLYNPYWLEFNHDYTFTILTYGFVFWLWMIWVNKYSQKETK